MPGFVLGMISNVRKLQETYNPMEVGETNTEEAIQNNLGMTERKYQRDFTWSYSRWSK